MKYAVIGSVGSTQVAINTLAEAGFPPSAVITIPQQKSGRNSDYVDLDETCRKLDVPCLRQDDVNEPHFVERIAGMELDLLLVIGWSRLVGQGIRDCARLGTIGYHPALLPRMRGRAVLAWTILLGETETGGTLFWIDDGVDSGPILAQRRIALTGSEYLSDLMDAQMDALVDMCRDLAGQMEGGAFRREVQDEYAASYCAARRPADGLIDWSADAVAIERLVRAVSRPFPGAFSHLRSDVVRVWKATAVESAADYHAIVGQVFAADDGRPLVRCGSNTTLRLEEFDIEGSGSALSIAGQPVLKGTATRRDP